MTNKYTEIEVEIAKKNLLFLRSRRENIAAHQIKLFELFRFSDEKMQNALDNHEREMAELEQPWMEILLDKAA